MLTEDDHEYPLPSWLILPCWLTNIVLKEDFCPYKVIIPTEDNHVNWKRPCQPLSFLTKMTMPILFFLDWRWRYQCLYNLFDWIQPCWLTTTKLTEAVHVDWRQPCWLKMAMFTEDDHVNWRRPCWQKLTMHILYPLNRYYLVDWRIELIEDFGPYKVIILTVDNHVDWRQPMLIEDDHANHFLSWL